MLDKIFVIMALGYLYLLILGLTYMLGMTLFIAISRCLKDEDVVVTLKTDKTILLVSAIIAIPIWVVMWRSI